MRFQILEFLGSGGFGRVSLAYDTQTGLNVALKELVNCSASNLERFAREARMLQSFANPNLIKIVAADMRAATPYIALELAVGSLDEEVGTVDYMNALSVIEGVCLGLAPLHAAGGHHRDIKPANLLLVEDEHGDLFVKVTDLGIARRPNTAVGSGMTRNIGGTDGYMPPERVPSAAGDMFALGITGIELMTGVRSTEAINNIAAPPAVKSLLRAMTATSPRARPTGAQILDTIARIRDGFDTVPVAAAPLPLQLAQVASNANAWKAIGIGVAAAIALLVASTPTKGASSHAS